MSDNAAGWQADPTGRFEHRYWDGSQWTDNVSDAGVASTDAYTPDTAADPAGAPAADPAGDPTVAQPAAPGDPTVTWPAAPAPPSFTAPVPTAGGGPDAASSGSKKRLLIGGGILAVIAIAVIALLALGNDDKTDTTDTTDTTDRGGPIGLDGDLPPGFEQQLAEVYETSMGLPQKKAECLAGKIADAIDSGELSEEQAMSDIFGYLSDCDIDMSELSGN